MSWRDRPWYVNAAIMTPKALYGAGRAAVGASRLGGKAWKMASMAHSGIVPRVASFSNYMGKSLFAANYARGGATASLFAKTSGGAMRNALGLTMKPRANSQAHLRGVERIAKETRSPFARMAARKMRETNQYSARAIGGRAIARGLGMAVGGAFIGYDVATAKPGAVSKTKAFAHSVGMFAGFSIGAKVGLGVGSAAGIATMGTGAAIGIVGMAAGALAGAAVLGGAAVGAVSIATNIHEKEASKRKVDWIHDQSAFQTQKAHTMRQMSMQAMNRGMTSARSMLGREGVMFHS